MVNTFPDVISIAEPYTLNQGDMIIRDGILSRSEITAVHTDSFIEHAEHVNSVMRSSSIHQPVIMKLFIFDNHDNIPEVINTLIDANFKFAVNKRNAEQQLLSMGLACTTNYWNSLAGCYKHTGNVINKVGFDSMCGLYENIIRFDDQIKNLGVPAPFINYETMQEDIASFLEIPTHQVVMKTRLKKQGPENLYDCIVNKEEVSNFIKKLLNTSIEEL